MDLGISSAMESEIKINKDTRSSASVMIDW